MAAEEEKQIHVLMVTFSSQGHMNPLFRLGKRLTSRGLRVTLATTEDGRSQILKHLAKKSTATDTTIATATISGVHLAFYSDGLSLDYDRNNNMDYYMETIEKCGPINLSSLIQTLPKVSCIITNPFVPWAADVAADHIIPCALLWIQSCTLYAIYYLFYNGLNSFPTKENPNMSVELPGLPLLHTQDLPSFVLPSNPFGSFPKMFSNMFKSLNKFKWVLGNSFHELEKADSMGELHPIKLVGPLVPPRLLGEDPRLDIGIEMWKSKGTCIEWLNQQNPNSVTYISFGSILVLSSKQMENIAVGIKNSKCPFLWVVKPPDYPPQPDHCGELPQGFLEETKEQGLVVPWCPQVEVLALPAISCFLTHCGWNSMLETIAAGVPVIAYPQWTDQPTNAKLMVDVFGVGMRLEMDSEGVVTSEQIESCIKEMTSGSRGGGIRKKALELKQAARDAVAEGGTSDRNIQAFVDEIIAGSCN